MTTSTMHSTDSIELAPVATPYDALTNTVRELVKVMREGGIGHLDVRQGDLRISLKSGTFVESHRTRSETIPTSVDDVHDVAIVEEGHVVTSPMIGTYYSSPGPNERPFVHVGDRVEAGQTVAIIEAMKIMNEIVSERSGTVAEIFVRNGEAVEYGHGLMRLKE